MWQFLTKIILLKHENVPLLAEHDSYNGASAWVPSPALHHATRASLQTGALKETASRKAI